MKKVFWNFAWAVTGLIFMSYGVLGLIGDFRPGTRPEIFVLLIIFGAALMVSLMMDKK